MPAFIDLVGRRFGLLTVLSVLPRELWKSSHSEWLCQCDCGNTTTVRGTSLKTGNTKSCGCIRKNAKKKNHNHAEMRSGTYNSWNMMKQRCTNSKRADYKNYGGRQPNPVTIYEPWLEFDNFLADMGERPDWATGGIDRIDSEKGYTPGNCRWVDKHTQSMNRKKKVKA